MLKSINIRFDKFYVKNVEFLNMVTILNPYFKNLVGAINKVAEDTAFSK